MNKLSLIARKIAAIFLLFTLVLTLNITAFADSPDTSPNVPRRTEEATQPASKNNSSTIPADVKPVKTYTVVLGKTYKLPADVRQTGDQYSTSNSSVLKVDGKTGSFTTLVNGTAYIVVANNGAKRYIKITVGTSTTTQTKSALTGYMVTVKDKTTPATNSSSKEYPIQTYRFYSANGTELGSISGDTFNKVISTANKAGSTSEWLTAEFNLYRGLSGSSTNTGTSADGNTADNTGTSNPSLGTLINNQRVSDGLPELTYDSEMQSLADTRAKEISQSFSHTRPDGTNVATTYYYAEINHSGSNNPTNVFNGYYNSTGHRNVMLDTRYNYYAIGTYQSNGRNYWVVLFN